MAKNRPSVRKKPTNKEIAAVLIEINRKVSELANGVNEAFSVLRQLDSIIGMYVRYEWQWREIQCIYC